MANSEQVSHLWEQLIYKVHYARFANGRREHWPESVQRYGNFFRGRVPLTLQEEFEDALRMVEQFQVMPSMRALWSAGPALERENLMGYNCSALPIDRPRAFSEILYLLMCTCGVGFSVEQKYISKLPKLKPTLRETTEVIVVEDTRAGWAHATNRLVNKLYAGEIPKWDLSRIRPEGAVLKTSGGRASGPGPLHNLFQNIVAIFKRASGDRLSSLNCMDLVCHVASAVVAGGVRRSATICLADSDDLDVANSKSGNFWATAPQRELTNISLVWETKPDIIDFTSNWLNLMKSGSGEPGIFNREAARLACKMTDRRDSSPSFLTNPCVPLDTLILTDWGHFPIGDFIGVPVEVWNGFEFSQVKPFKSGIKDLVDVELSDGLIFRCSTNHIFVLKDGSRVEANDLEQGDKLQKFNYPIIYSGFEYTGNPYSQGFYSGDGATGSRSSKLYRPKYCVKERLQGTVKKTEQASSACVTWTHGTMFAKDFVPIDGVSWYCLDWLAGYLDADGVVTRDKNGDGVQVSSVNKKFLMDIKLMLSRLGVYVKVINDRDAQERLLPDGHGGHKDYMCQKMYRMCIDNQETYQLTKLGLKLSRLKLRGKPPQRSAQRFTYVVSVTPCGQGEVACFTEPRRNLGTFNGLVTGNCGETILRENGLCNLTSVIVHPNDSREDLRQKVCAATLLGCIQATMTDFHYVSKSFITNATEERLLGVSLTGLRDHYILKNTSAESRTLLEQLKFEVRIKACEYAEALGINVPAAVTLIKPEGTVSQLVNASAGLHPRYARHYIRRIRLSKTDPIVNLLHDNGIKSQLDWTQSACDYNRLVFEFPLKSPDGSILVKSVDAVEQLRYWKMLKQQWCEHNPSCTIYVKDHEWLTVGAWVYKNWDSVCGLTFYPVDSGVHQLAPYEEITEDRYNEMLQHFPDKDIDFMNLAKYENDDNTTGAKEYACAGGKCDV